MSKKGGYHDNQAMTEDGRFMAYFLKEGGKENALSDYVLRGSFDDVLVFRHADLEEELEGSYQILRIAAEENNLGLQEPFYHIYLEVYGGGIIDIFVPIVKGD